MYTLKEPHSDSSLFLARSTVHFNAVCERFTPYDTTFEITKSTELKDTKLSAACSLHAASGSHSSSNSSLRRRRLGEIAEEEEEEQRANKRQSLLHDNEAPKTSDEPSSPTAPVTLNSELAASPEQSSFAAPTTSEVPTFVGVDDERPTSSGESIDAARRNSSQSGRPDLFSYSQYNYGKPKVKIGPRPSVDSTGRPRTAGNYRPVSQIPAGFKLFGKGHKKGASKDKHDEFTAPPDDNTLVTTTISVPEDSQLEVMRPATSSGVSTRSSIVPMPMSPTKPAMTPEKARLMKAMKLREKKKKMAIETAADAPVPTLQSPASIEEEAEDKSEEAEPNADSGIVLDASSSSMNTDRASEDSHPASPIIASSEPDQSTKASSVSDSTDETVQAKSEDALDRDFEENIPEKPVEKSVPIEDSPTIPDTLFKAMPVKIATPDMGEIEEASDEESDTADERESPSVAQTRPAEKPVEEVVTVADPPLRIPTPPLPNTTEPKTNEIPDEPETTHPDETNVNKETPTPSAPPLKIPKSKFSTQDLRSDARGSPIPTISTPVEDNWRDESPLGTIEEPNLGQGEHERQKQGVESTAPVTELKPPKRKAFVEPIRTNLDAYSRSDAHISDDESLMDELQSATVHEAKSMLVAKSPVTPVFPSPTKGGPRPHIIRTASNPVRGQLLTPNDVGPNSARSLSSGAAYLNKVAQQQQVGNLTAKTNVGSSISQRIKALEKLSSSTGGDANNTLAPSRDRPSSTFFSVRKGREPSRSPSVVDRASSFARPTKTPPSRSGSRDGPSLESSWHSRRERSGSVTSRLSMFEAFPEESLPPGNTSRGRPETISVTAKIVRDPSQNAAMAFEPPKDVSEYNRLELRQSPLVVDHQKATPPPQWTPLASETKETIRERRLSRESRRAESPEKSRRSSLTVVKDFIKDSRKSLTSPSSDALAAPSPPSSSRSPTRSPSAQQNSSFTQRLSMSSRRSSFSRDRENVASPSTTEGSGSGDEKSEKKKSSRAGRFMRRLSNLSSGRGKASTPNDTPTVTEEELVESKPRAQPASAPTPPQPSASTPSIVSYMGDVNVQFPDTLLWKRRNLCLDSQGFLTLSAQPAQNGRPAQATKRYHLSEFRPPYIPDVEVQELPNSVVLDLIEGSGVQIACEDRVGQGNILTSKFYCCDVGTMRFTNDDVVLREAHAGHASTFGQ